MESEREISYAYIYIMNTYIYIYIYIIHVYIYIYICIHVYAAPMGGAEGRRRSEPTGAAARRGLRHRLNGYLA